MMDSLHRILSGAPERRIELVTAGIFVAVWFAKAAPQRSASSGVKKWRGF
jgi:hypothetical protein